MGKMTILRLAFFVGSAALVLVEIARSRRQKKSERASLGASAAWGLGIVAAGASLFEIFLWVNHLQFPLHLWQLEGVVLQSTQRVAAGLPVYVTPSPEFVPLAYNPLYYYIAVPFLRLFGGTLFSLRLFNLLAGTATLFLLFLIVRKRTDSYLWAGISAGLFAASYRAIDCYPDHAPQDALLVVSALLGFYVIELNRSRSWSLVGVALLACCFWSKQYGALFTVGGVLYLTWREGWRRSFLYWASAALLGPGLFFLAGPRLLGPYFLYFTWVVPRRWTVYDVALFGRLVKFLFVFYPVLTVAATWFFLRRAGHGLRGIDIWTFQYPFVLMMTVVALLDGGSDNNAFVPIVVWLALIGVFGLHELALRAPWFRLYQWATIGLFLSFGLLIYNPLEVVSSPHAAQSYQELLSMLRGLDGQVYDPWIGYLRNDFGFYPSVQYNTLDDIIGVRKPVPTEASALVNGVLEPAIRPRGPAYILTNVQLEQSYGYTARLSPYYILYRDFRGQFESLRGLPVRWDPGYPRYLYRSKLEEAKAP